MQKKTYKNTTTYKRCTHSEEHPFTVISNYLIRELESEDPQKKINFTELGFMTYLLSNSDTFIFNSEYVQKFISGVGQDKYYRMVEHLIELGYIQKKPRKEGGWNWEINEIIFHKSSKATDEDLKTIDNARISENPNRENPNREIPNTENTSLISTNKTITIEEVKKEKVKIERNNNSSVVGEAVEGKLLDLSEVRNSDLDSEEDHTSKVIDQNTSMVETHNTPTQDLERSDNTESTPTNKLVVSDDLPTIEPDQVQSSVWFSGDSLKTVKELHNAFNNPKERKLVTFQQFEKLLAFQFVDYSLRINKTPTKADLQLYVEDISKDQELFFKDYDFIITLIPKDNLKAIQNFNNGLNMIS